MNRTSGRGKSRKVLSVLGMLVPLVFLLPAVGAMPPSTVSGTIVVGSPGFALIRIAGDITIYTVTEHDTYAGALQGITIGESTLRLDASGNFTLEGRHAFAGTVDGVSGSLVLLIEARGTFPTFFEGRLVILSGTDGLANLHGSWTVQGVPDVAGTYSGQVHFDPA